MSVNKPIAWIDFIEESNVYDLNVSGRGIPLYFEHKPQVVRAPTYKTLTDDEITQVFDECYPNNSDGDVVTLIDFARAILNKAKEK